MAQTYVLYGAEMSLYTGKVRSYLHYKQLPFTEIFSSLGIYKNTLIPNTGVKVIPVVKTPHGEYLQDTSHIIDSLENSSEQRSITPEGPKQKLVSALFEIWADEWLLIPAMHYRWNKDNSPFIYQEFGRVVMPKMPAWIRGFAGKKVAKKFKGFVPILGITDDTQRDIEIWYEQHVLNQLNKHFAQHDYLLGGRPCLGDFGLMGPLYAHLYRDPAPRRVMEKLAPHVVSWINRMNQPQQQVGEWIADDQIPETLASLLARQFQEFWPVMQSTQDAAEAFAAQHDSEKSLPRSVGQVPFQIGDSQGTRVAFSHHLWKIQRLLNGFDVLDKSEQDEVKLGLAQYGGDILWQLKQTPRVERRDNRLYLK